MSSKENAHCTANTLSVNGEFKMCECESQMCGLHVGSISWAPRPTWTSWQPPHRWNPASRAPIGAAAPEWDELLWELPSFYETYHPAIRLVVLCRKAFSDHTECGRGFLDQLHINKFQKVWKFSVFNTGTHIKKIPSKLEVAPPPKCGVGDGWVGAKNQGWLKNKPTALSETRIK